MGRYIIQRVLAAFPVLLIVTLISFCIMRSEEHTSELQSH